MSPETDAVGDAATGLVEAMAQLVRAMDGVGDDGQAAAHIPDSALKALETLAARLNAAKGFSA